MTLVPSISLLLYSGCVCRFVEELQSEVRRMEISSPPVLLYVPREVANNVSILCTALNGGKE